VARVVLTADARRGKANHLLLFGIGQPDRAADARFEVAVLGERHRDHSLAKIGLDKQACLVTSNRLSDQVTRIKRRVRPGRLR